ncbi:hypothetical protein C2E23DRAFT_325969 [Lenzites betulinus]|nr:hypothetical protein C2E23DRAFT_325969 [Lenzites betulinus]
MRRLSEVAVNIFLFATYEWLPHRVAVRSSLKGLLRVAQGAPLRTAGAACLCLVPCEPRAQDCSHASAFWASPPTYQLKSTDCTEASLGSHGVPRTSSREVEAGAGREGFSHNDAPSAAYFSDEDDHRRMTFFQVVSALVLCGAVIWPLAGCAGSLPPWICPCGVRTYVCVVQLRRVVLNLGSKKRHRTPPALYFDAPQRCRCTWLLIDDHKTD